MKIYGPKWAVITELCTRRGFETAAKVARAIDSLLKVLYPTEYNLQQFYVEAALIDTDEHVDIMALAQRGDKCIACANTPMKYTGQKLIKLCDKCKFAKYAGKCGGHDMNLYDIFLRRLDNDANQKYIVNYGRKWERIAIVCDTNGKHRAADIARAIDALLQVLYVDADDDAFKVSLRADSEIYRIDVLASDASLCVACTHARRVDSCLDKCNRCYFARFAGVCREVDSLYGMFIDALYGDDNE